MYAVLLVLFFGGVVLHSSLIVFGGVATRMLLAETILVIASGLMAASGLVRWKMLRCQPHSISVAMLVVLVGVGQVALLEKWSVSDVSFAMLASFVLGPTVFVEASQWRHAAKASTGPRTPNRV